MSLQRFISFLLIGLSLSANADHSLLQKPGLKVLDIGNSYTDDATAMLPLIANASGTDLSDMCLYKAVRGAGSFKNWYDRYYDRDNHSYYIKKILGGINANINTGSGEGTDGTLFGEALENETWDIIIIHQYSRYAPYYAEWGTTSNGGYLNELLSLIKEKQPQAAIGFLLIHSYWDEYSGNKEKSSYERWRLIANSVKQLYEDYDIDFVIPYGTAVENLRSSSLNNEYDFTKDGSHCGLGLCRYTAACCYYEALIAPRSGISVLGNTARYDASNAESQYPAISVTDENALIAQKAAVLANTYWYECINPENTIREGYTFTGWDSENSVPLFTINQYTVKFIVDGEVIQSDVLDYNSPITIPEVPEKEGYTFLGWGEVEATVPAHDVTYTGIYSRNTYKIRYYVGDELYAEDEVEYGAPIILRDYVTESDRYSFEGWDGERYETMPAHDIEYRAAITDGTAKLFDSTTEIIDVYTLSGQKVKSGISIHSLRLPAGIFIQKDKKVYCPRG